MMFVHTGQHSVDTPWWWGGSRTSRRNRSIIISSSIAAAGDHIAVPSGLDILMTGLLYKVIFSLACALNSNPQTPSISG